MDENSARQIVLAARPQGAPKPSDFRLEEVAIVPPGPGELSLRTDWLSLDPYMRGRMDDRKSYAPATAIGAVMEGESIATVTASNVAGFAAGDVVLSRSGWRTHAISNGRGLRKIDPSNAPITTNLGVLGMPGFTAYGGMRVIGQPKAGETVVVAAASGPVGSLVGQLAQMAGARAVGIAGGAQKCAYVKDELGFDAVVDHRGEDMATQLARACPGGVDVYFENVGGAVWRAVFPLLNDHARVPVCGLIAEYNAVAGSGERDRLPATMREILSRSLTLRGFLNYEFNAYFEDFMRDVGAAVKAGKIRYREDIVDGFENAPAAFMGMLEGRNFGKLLVRVSPA